MHQSKPIASEHAAATSTRKRLVAPGHLKGRGRQQLHRPTSEPPRADPHAYPHDLAVLVRARWPVATTRLDVAPSDPVREAPLVRCPDLAVLERLLSICYQASLLHEEGRPTTFRVALIEPEGLAECEGPPGGLLRLVFSHARVLDAHELRRLASATPFQHALVGIRFDPKLGLLIWGLIHSGPRWLQSVRGGREIRQRIPAALMIAVSGPGRVLVSAGIQTVAELKDGTMTSVSLDVFKAPWLEEVFSDIRRTQETWHAAARARAGGTWALLDPNFGPLLAQHVLRRIVATIRGAHHGGTLILVPSTERSLVEQGRHIKLKYPFRDEEPRRRILTLIVRTMNDLAKLHSPPSGSPFVGWADFESSASERLAALDEAVFEVAHLIAALAYVDGAVVMTTRLEVLGFGGEIGGDLAEISAVARAFDLAGNEREEVSTDRVGTRHRSAYRLCQGLHEAVAIVISHDGGVRFTRWHDGQVTYWDQVATGPWEV